MAYRREQEEDEAARELSAAPMGVASAGGAMGGPAAAPASVAGPSAARPGGWVNLQNYLGANQGAGEAMAQTALGGVREHGDGIIAELNRPRTNFDPSGLQVQANNVAAQARLLSTPEGRVESLAKHVQGPYGGGARRLDSFLMGQTGAFEGMDKYAGLGQAVADRGPYKPPTPQTVTLAPIRTTVPGTPRQTPLPPEDVGGRAPRRRQDPRDRDRYPGGW